MNNKNSQMEAMWEQLASGTDDERATAAATKAVAEPCICGDQGYTEASDMSDDLFRAEQREGGLVSLFASVGATLCPSDNCTA